MKNLIIYFLVFSVLLSSCYTTYYTKTHTQIMDDFLVLRPYKADIILAKGPPDAEIDDGNGGKVMTYDESYVKTIGHVYPKDNILPTLPNYYSTSHNIERKIFFYIDKNNYCYKWRSVGIDLKYGWPNQKMKFSPGKTMLLLGFSGAMAILIAITVENQ